MLVLQAYRDQALLLLATGALAMRILHAPLEPALPVLSTFKVIFCLLLFCVQILSNYLHDITSVKFFFFFLNVHFSAF